MIMEDGRAGSYVSDQIVHGWLMIMAGEVHDQLGQGEAPSAAVVYDLCDSCERVGAGGEGGQGFGRDAAITIARGKKKYLFDFAFVLDWEVELDCGPAAKGTPGTRMCY
jgi:hypothetical protein